MYVCIASVFFPLGRDDLISDALPLLKFSLFPPISLEFGKFRSCVGAPLDSRRVSRALVGSHTAHGLQDRSHGPAGHHTPKMYLVLGRPLPGSPCPRASPRDCSTLLSSFSPVNPRALGTGVGALLAVAPAPAQAPGSEELEVL